MNLAVSYHLRRATVLVGETYEMDYPEVLISKGDLPGMQSPTATSTVGTTLALTWQDNSDQGLAAPTDRLFVVCYCPELDRFEMYEDVTNRDDEEASLDLPSFYADKRVEVWATFVAANHHHAATSSYLGSIQLS
jgi:hypothetical protein